MSETSHKQPWAWKQQAKTSPLQQRFSHGQVARHRPTHLQHNGQRKTV